MHFALENPSDSHLFKFMEICCPKFLMTDDEESRSDQESRKVFSQSVSRCPYDDTPEPRLWKLYKWISSFRGIKGLNARCSCKLAHRKLGFKTNNGGWSGDPQALGESAAYPDRLGKALFDMWAKHAQPVDVAWSSSVLSLMWVDPRVNMETAMPQDLSVKVSRGSAESEQTPKPKPDGCMGPWGSASTRDGPWGNASTDECTSRKQLRVQKSRSDACKQQTQTMGPWDSRASGPWETELSSSSSNAMGPWSSSEMSSATASDVKSFGPWSCAQESRSESCAATSKALGPWASMDGMSSSSDEAEAVPGQIGSPQQWGDRHH